MSNIYLGFAALALLFAAPAQASDFELCVKFDPATGEIKNNSLIRLREECKTRNDGTPREISLGKASNLQRVLKTCDAYGGVKVDGNCWFLGGRSQSCTDVCTSIGATCDDEGATRHYAGSGGSAQNCETVLTALDMTPSQVYTSSGDQGCVINDTFFHEYWKGSQQPAPSLTTCDAATEGQLVRACACNLPQ